MGAPFAPEELQRLVEEHGRDIAQVRELLRQETAAVRRALPRRALTGRLKIAGHPHPEIAGGSAGSGAAHDTLSGIGADDHHDEAHTAASHSDQGATGAELETLTDGSDADALHVHPAGSHGTTASISDHGEVAAMTEAQGDILYFDGSDWNRLAAGTNGYFLKTLGAGADPAWASPGAGGNHNLLNAGDHPDTISASPEVGKMIRGAASNWAVLNHPGAVGAIIRSTATTFAWITGTTGEILAIDSGGAVIWKAIGASARILQSDGSESLWVAMSGDATIVAGGAITVVSASTSVAGKVELATAAEVDAGSAATRAITPAALAGSNAGIRYMPITVFGPATSCVTGNGKMFTPAIPAGLNLMDLVSVSATVFVAGTGGSMTIQVHNKTDTADMLSTVLTVAASAVVDDGNAVIDTGADDIVTDNIIQIDVDTVHSTTPALGLIVLLGFRIP